MADYNFLDRELREILSGGCEKIYIYPFGEAGMQVKRILSERYGKHCIIIDNMLCNYNEEIINCCGLEGKQWDDKDVVIITADGNDSYMDIRVEINKWVPKKYIKDLFPVHPLIHDRDERVASLAAAAREIYRKNIAGAVAEAGVYQGEFAKVMNRMFPDRRLYLFDSFEGFNRESVVEGSDNINQTNEWIDTLKDTSVDIVMKKMTFPQNVIVKKGYIPDTLESISDKFCFVNLDMDLYAPIYEGLKFFWDNLAGGGYIFVHDFYLWDGVEAAVRKFCKERSVGYMCMTDANSIVIAKPET